MLQGISNAAAAPTKSYLLERRILARKPVIKSAKLAVGSLFNEGLYNCLVLDESKGGAMVDLGTVVPLPEEVMLHMTGGSSYRARVRWAAGSKVGLEFTSHQIVPPATLHAMQHLGRMLHSQGLPAAMAALRAEGFLGNNELRKAAEAAEAAFHLLETALNLG